MNRMLLLTLVLTSLTTLAEEVPPSDAPLLVAPVTAPPLIGVSERQYRIETHDVYRPNLPLLISGGAVFVAGWAPIAVLSMFAAFVEGLFAPSDALRTLEGVIPFAGPMLLVPNDPLMIAATVVQIGGAAMAIIGAVSGHTVQKSRRVEVTGDGLAVHF